MIRKGFLRATAFAALFTGLAAAASAQVTISGGFALSSVELEGVPAVNLDSELGFGGNVFVDYLLPIGVPLSLGFEVGYDTASLKSGNGFEMTGYAIPLLARVAYHFDLMANLDLYLVGKVGYALGGGTQKEPGYADITEDGINGMGFGFDVGAAFYFNSRFGIFAEAGFERYSLEKGFTAYDYYGSYSYTLEFPFSRFVIVGISAKF
jgi:hypothetical protein